MDQAIQQFILALATERGASQNTLGAYQTDLRQLEDYLSREGITSWAVVGPEILQSFIAYLTEREYATTSIARKLAAAKSFFQFLCAANMVSNDPAREVRAPRVEKYLPHALSSQEVARLFTLPTLTTPAGLRDAAMLHVLYATGLRVSELVAMAPGDLDTELTTIRCPGRNGRTRRLPVSERARDALDAYLTRGRPQLVRDEASDALFLNHHGERLTRQGFWLIMKGYARAAGVADITPHTLRHSFALDMIDRGMELRSVQELLGHANISTTQMYRHLLKAHTADACPACGEDAVGGTVERLETQTPVLVNTKREECEELLRPGAR